MKPCLTPYITLKLKNLLEQSQSRMTLNDLKALKTLKNLEEDLKNLLENLWNFALFLF